MHVLVFVVQVMARQLDDPADACEHVRHVRFVPRVHAAGGDQRIA